MKNFIPIFFILISFVAQASMLNITSDLQKNADDLEGGFLSKGKPPLETYIEQAQKAKEAICNTSQTYKMLEARNIWAEIQAAANIQKYTTQKFIETCSQLTAGNKEVCDKNLRDGKSQGQVSTLSRLYSDIQVCANQRVEERLSSLAQKLNKKKILTCNTANIYSEEIMTEFLGGSANFVNPKFSTLSFEEVARLPELNASTCKIGNKEYDLKKILVYSAVNNCMKNNFDYESCLKTKCSATDKTCRTQYRDVCFKQALTLARDFGREPINECLTQQVLNPSDKQVQETKSACLKGETLNRFQAKIKEVGFSVSSNNDCYRKENCKQTLEAAFDQLNEGNEICGSQITQSKGSTRSSSGASSK